MNGLSKLGPLWLALGANIFTLVVWGTTLTNNQAYHSVRLKAMESNISALITNSAENRSRILVIESRLGSIENSQLRTESILEKLLERTRKGQD